MLIGQYKTISKYLQNFVLFYLLFYTYHLHLVKSKITKNKK